MIKQILYFIVVPLFFLVIGYVIGIVKSARAYLKLRKAIDNTARLCVVISLDKNKIPKSKITKCLMDYDKSMKSVFE